MMKIVTSLALAASLVTGISTQASAASHTCGLENGVTPYCAYTGKVKQVYINDANRILMLFETPFDRTAADAVGYAATSNTSAATLILTSTNRDFAMSVYSTLLTARASGEDVSIQMRGVSGPYPILDRVWY